MFRRRLRLLFMAFALVCAILAAQAYRLTVLQGGEHLSRAEDRLVSERWTPTIRGRILDRKGRVLAHDEPSFHILIDYPIISGEWVQTRAQGQARRENRKVWGSLTPAERETIIARARQEHEAMLAALWIDLAAALNIPIEELEARRQEIRDRVDREARAVWQRWLDERREEASAGKGKAIDLTIADVQRPLAIHVQPHMIAHGVDESIGFDIRRLAEKYPGIHVEPGGRRDYPFESVQIEVSRTTFPAPLRPASSREEVNSAAPAPPPPPIVVEVQGLATHILGWMRGVQAEDLVRRPRLRAGGEIDPGHYQSADRVGARGIEGGYEHSLRGLRGRRIRHLDIAEGEPGAEEVTEPVPGGDVMLSIDAMLQARIHAIMLPQLGLASMQAWHMPAVVPEGQPPPLPEGTPLHGAAIVLEIDSGEILAMVSTPSFTRADLATNPSAIFEDAVNTPWVNRAVSKPYPPGSIVKPLILSAAVTSGSYDPARAIECTGHLIPDKPERYRCWVFKQFDRTHTSVLGGPLLAPEAMAVSCNIFFYTLARDLGIERVIKWYRDFGVGSAPPLHIDDIYPGSVGVVPSGEQLGAPHAILMGIGQGPVAWTPLHAADAYATIARGGTRLIPRLVRTETPMAQDLHIDPRALDDAIEGLRGSVNADYGTGHMLRYPDGTREPVFTPRPGIEVIGKTGTAEAPDIIGDPNPRDAERIRRVLREGDHSWFVIMVGPTGGRPRYAIAVVMDYAGSGGRVSGPIANQIIEALIAEGYL